MEPMLVGSPVSPAGGAAGAPSSSAAPFLPSFLLGDTHHTPSSRVPLPGSSPGSRSHFSSSGVAVGQGSPVPHMSAKEPVPSSLNTPRFGRGVGERPSGPPVQCLGAGMSPVASHTPTLQQRLHSPYPDHLHRTPRTPLGSPMRGPHTPHSYQLQQQQHLLNSSNSGALNTSIISSEVHSDVAASSALADDWVTVFGFPVASASYILTQFAQLGTIADQRLPGSGNWMHLKYQTSLQARKALALNGKVFSNNIMIGVIPCNDRSVVMAAADANKENQRIMANSSFMSPAVSNTSGLLGAGDGSISTPKSGIRSLTQTYQTTPSENQVIPAANTPKKNDSFMAKAMQHLLGV